MLVSKAKDVTQATLCNIHAQQLHESALVFEMRKVPSCHVVSRSQSRLLLPSYNFMRKEEI